MAKPVKKRLNITNVQKKYLFKILGIDKIEDIDIAILKRLKEKIKKLTDVRQKGKICYKLWDIVMCVIIANFTGIESWDDIVDFVVFKYDWLRKFLKMTGGIPDAQTYERVISLIDSRELEDMLTDFFFEITQDNSQEEEMLNIDGRVSRGSSRSTTNYRKEKTKPLNVLSVYSNKYGICLASEKIDDKTNEIPTIPIILERLNIKGVIITWDALNTQKENIKCVIDKLGDYVVPVKGNHETFYKDLELYFDEKKIETIIAGNTATAYLRIEEKSHSSFITYEYFQTSDVDWYYDKESWKGLKSIGLVRKTIVKNNQTKVEMRYYISSLNVDIKNFSNAIRNQWSVENKLHWHLDFTFREDKNTTANKQALMNLQLINKFCLAILERVKPFYNNISLRRIRNKTTLDVEKEFANILCYLLLS